MDASTRFRAPAYVRNVIDRERLFGLLRAGTDRQLVVIHAPAGYGKTTLAVQWLRVLENEGAVAAWLGLHRDDNDPHWFLSHLLEAVRRTIPQASDAIADLKDLIEQKAQDTQNYTLSALLEQIACHDGRVVLTVDDWHLIEDPRVQHAMVHILDFAPPNLTLVLTSRTRPQLPLRRLRVREQLIEIDADTLRFDIDETRAFLIDLNGLPLDSRDVARVSTGTDGWVAALQLVSLSLRECADPAELIRRFSGRDHSIGEYLAENVLSALPPGILDFLLATSVCDRLSGGLAEALSGCADGQQMLEELERRDLFLRPLDTERNWFRYHHLFAEYLRRRLQRDHRDRVTYLHHRASAWLADHDLVAEAVTHALAAGDVGSAADLVERHAMPLVEHSRMVSLLGLTARLPHEVVDSRPRLLMAIAWANCLLQRSDAAQLVLDTLRHALPDGGDTDEMRREADVVQACIDVYGDRIDRAEALVSTSLQRADCSRAWVIAVAANIQTFCDIYSMRYRMARDRQRWARRFHDRTIGPFAGVYGRCFAGIAAFSQLDLDAAQEHLRDAVDLARESAGRRSHAAQLASALLGELLYERGEIDEAERLLEACRELGAESGVVDFMIASYVVLARVKARRGDEAAAAELLAEGTKVAEQLGLTRLHAAIAGERIRRLLQARRVREARHIAETLPDANGAQSGIGIAIDQIRTSSIAAVLSAEGDHDSAAALLQELTSELGARGQIRAQITVAVQLTSVLERGARHMAAERALAGALARTAPAGLRQTVLEGGTEINAVLRRLLEKAHSDIWADNYPDVPIGYLRTLTADSGDNPVSPGVNLSAREISILRLLETGRTNQQLARSLGVTVNTVKWYLKNIYSTLEASNRSEAVSIARRMNLLASGDSTNW